MTEVVLLHGFLGSPAAWEEVVAKARLAGSVEAPWLPGHGADPWGRGSASFDEAVDAISSRIRSQAFVLVGYSLGARVALRLALRHPSRIGGLVLVGVNPGLENPEERRARESADAERARAIRARGLAPFVAEWEEQPLFLSQKSLPEPLCSRRRAERLAHTAEGIAWSLEALGLARMPDCWPALPQLRSPVSVITGALDSRFTAIGARLAKTARAASHIVVPGVGHDVTLEAPEAVAREINRMLQGAQP